VNPDKSSTGSERKIGTAFVTVENQQFAKLWPELTVTAAMTSGRGQDDPDEKVKAAFWKRAGRNLALYLDLVAVEATSEVAASVDKSLVTLASSTSGAALREVLLRLREVYLEHCDETGTASSIRWAEVRSFLDSIGMIRAGDQS
jgi:hypothetical protein